MKRLTLVMVIICFLAACSGNNKSYQSEIQPGSIISDNDTCRLIDNYLTQLTKEKGFSGGLMIVKEGRKIFSKGYGLADKENKIPFTPGTLASMGSITKAFTAAAILKLAELKKIGLSDPLKKFFPEIPRDKEAITIHQLLTHSSGFHEFLKNDKGDYEKIEKDEYLKRAFSEPLAFKPGEKAIYTNVGMSILAIIIEKVSGLEYEQFLRKYLFEPAKIKNIGYHFPESKDDTIAIGYQNNKKWGTHQEHFEKAGGGPYWNLKGNGGLEASLNDMYLWVTAISEHKFLGDSLTSLMFSPQVKEEGNNGDSWFGYGCNISKSRRNTKMIGNGGSNGIYFARLLRLPEEGLIFYMVTNESSINTNMVLPNVTQLYFQGKITQDAVLSKPQFENPLSKRVFELLQNPSVTDLATEIKKAKLTIDDDMILLEVGQKLMQEGETDKALLLYKYYTGTFPNIVVAWNDLGDIYQTLSKPEEAIKCYQQALKIRPGNQRAKDNLDKITK